MTYPGFERPWSKEVNYEPLGEPVIRRDGVLVALYRDRSTGKYVGATITPDGDDSTRWTYTPEELAEHFGDGNIEAGINGLGRLLFNLGNPRGEKDS